MRLAAGVAPASRAAVPHAGRTLAAGRCAGTLAGAGTPGGTLAAVPLAAVAMW